MLEMTFYELLKSVYWALDEWIASSLGLGEYYGAEEDDVDEEVEEDDVDEDEVDNEEVDEEEIDLDDEHDAMYKYHDHQA
jgi:hypothetical protein